MSPTFPLAMAGESLLLHPWGAIFWARPKILFLADLHLGKASFFQSCGIPLPDGPLAADLTRWSHLLEIFQPDLCWILGDLFHAGRNREWDIFADWRKQQDLEFRLIKGNHDQLPDSLYQETGLSLDPVGVSSGPFILSHEPLPPGENSGINLHGHVHPGTVLTGKGRQRLRLPCFVQRKACLILPAFGGLTGLANYRPRPEQQLYATSGDRIFYLPNDPIKSNLNP